MGVGKSAVAEALSRLFQLPWVDTDRWIEDRCGLSPAELLRGPGEAELRRLEREAVVDVARSTGTVIATGGGVPLDPTNLELLGAGGVLVLLEACPAQLVRRLRESSQDRPLLAEIQEQVVRERLLSRAEAYGRIPHRVDTDHRRVEDVAREVYQIYLRHARPPGF